MTIIYACPAMKCSFFDRGKGEVCPKHKVKVVAMVKERIPRKYWIDQGEYRFNKSSNLKDIL